MQIGEASAGSGVSTKMIRHYESIGLLPEADRRQSGYRDYDHSDVHRLQFVRRARDLGFSIDQIRVLLRLWSDRNRSNAEVKRLALTHVAELKDKIKKLEQMSKTLSSLARACDGDGRPDCPILEGLGRGNTPSRRSKARR